ncbi:MAG: hypothetical protein JWM14_59 [Chitinophagaceae bacterium]|nr:hypothetical protein [Chitinophagaceae bacterium]
MKKSLLITAILLTFGTVVFAQDQQEQNVYNNPDPQNGQPGSNPAINTTQDDLNNSNTTIHYDIQPNSNNDNTETEQVPSNSKYSAPLCDGCALKAY